MALHGRDSDIALIDDAIASARAGRGRAVFLTGEAGIGKSSLLAEARERAQRADARVLAGAAWESGGAPPYWPWIQVFGGASTFATVTAAASAGTDAAAARFALLDSLVRTLVARAAERPIVLLLDDLHAADVPSLDVLVMLMRELPAASIAIVAAWREGELAKRPDAARALARAARSGSVQPLRRLTADEVATWVGADAHSIFESSEGNPLFVEELLRAKKGGAPHGLEAALADHVALVSDDTRELLAVASIAGREIDGRRLRELAGVADDVCERALREAVAAGIVEKRGASWRFKHVLLRDHLYEALPASRRAQLHRTFGELLATTDPASAAHHLLTGIASASDAARAIEMAGQSAEHAMKVYAFEDAAAVLTRALRAAETSGADALVNDVRIELARALHAAGRADLARAECVRVAATAGASPALLARTAMTYAAEIVSGRRDQTMIELLERALAAQAPGDSAIRARLMCRLAAARVPELPGEPSPQELAREALAMARRVGDDDALFYVLKFCVHAFGFRMSVWEAHKIATEVVAMSDRLGRPLEVLEHRTWLVGSTLAMGDMRASEAALENVAALLAPLRQPHYRWRVPILRAVHAVVRGNFSEADRIISSVEELAREYEIDRAIMAASFARLGLAGASRSPRRAQQVLATTRRLARIIGTTVSNCILAFVEALAGDAAAARAQLRADVFEPRIVLMQFGAEAVTILGDVDLAPVAIETMREAGELHPVLNGPAGSLVMRPVDLVVGELLLLLGKVDEALEPLERGLALARKLESPPFVANGASLIARALDMRAKPGDRERAVALAAEAQQLTAQCSLETRAVPLQDPKPAAVPDNSLALVSRGVIAWRGKQLALPASKGGDYLATLIAAPGREVHVSDLVGDDDRGDAGEVLDAKARAAYKQRAEELTEDLEAARARNDIGRAEQLAAELEAITDELLAATGLGGRTRKSGSRVERARVNVQRRIKDAIRRLIADDEALGRYLEATVRTGTFCSFVPVDR